MKQTIPLGKNLYLNGLFKMRDVESNYAYPIDFPIIFEAYGAGIRSGNWRSCTGINTPEYIAKYFQRRFEERREQARPGLPETWVPVRITSNYQIHFKGLTESEHYELHGLINSIASVSEAYSVFRFGNHGTHEGRDISHMETAKKIFESTRPMVERVNELLLKIQGLQKITD